MSDVETKGRWAARSHTGRPPGKASALADPVSVAVGVASLCLSLFTLLGSGLVAVEVRGARVDWVDSQFSRIGADHEARIRSLESSELRLEGKIDLILQRVAAKPPEGNG